jgi:hypothetical protein
MALASSGWRLHFVPWDGWPLLFKYRARSLMDSWLEQYRNQHLRLAAADQLQQALIV